MIKAYDQQYEVLCGATSIGKKVLGVVQGLTIHKNYSTDKGPQCLNITMK